MSHPCSDGPVNTETFAFALQQARPRAGQEDSGFSRPSTASSEPAPEIALPGSVMRPYQMAGIIRDLYSAKARLPVPLPRPCMPTASPATSSSRQTPMVCRGQRRAAAHLTDCLRTFVQHMENTVVVHRHTEGLQRLVGCSADSVAYCDISRGTPPAGFLTGVEEG